MKKIVKLPSSKQSRNVFFLTTIIYAVLIAYQVYTERRMPSLATEWVYYMPLAMFAIAVAYYQYTNLSRYRVDKTGITHKTLFGLKIRKISWSSVKTAEVATVPNMPFSPVYILVSDSKYTPAKLRTWLKETHGSDDSSIFAIPYSDDIVECINRYSPINCGSLVHMDAMATNI